MNHKKAIIAMSALSQPVRLSAVVALTRQPSTEMNVNDLAAAIGALHNSMSVHLAVLARAGIVKSTKAGRETIYRANRPALAELGAFITELAGS